MALNCDALGLMINELNPKSDLLSCCSESEYSDSRNGFVSYTLDQLGFSSEETNSVLKVYMILMEVLRVIGESGVDVASGFVIIPAADQLVSSVNDIVGIESNSARLYVFSGFFKGFAGEIISNYFISEGENLNALCVEMRVDEFIESHIIIFNGSFKDALVKGLG